MYLGGPPVALGELDGREERAERDVGEVPVARLRAPAARRHAGRQERAYAGVAHYLHPWRVRNVPVEVNCYIVRKTSTTYIIAICSLRID